MYRVEARSDRFGRDCRQVASHAVKPTTDNSVTYSTCGSKVQIQQLAVKEQPVRLFSQQFSRPGLHAQRVESSFKGVFFHLPASEWVSPTALRIQFFRVVKHSRIETKIKGQGT
jgi:hypothetical protein